jgi:diguanylate cyclase (GGDEF)-like protein
MNLPMVFLFGNYPFVEGEEYKRFRYQFACMLLLFSAVITAMLLALVALRWVVFDPLYLWVYRAYLVVCIGHYAVLRNRPRRLTAVAISYLCIFLVQQTATLLLNTPDELRIIWLLLNLPGVYLVLGARAGALVMMISMALIAAVNPHLNPPYSLNALATCFIGMLYLSAFFQAFLNKSISFHHAMSEANRKLELLAFVDPLTGVMNTRGYYSETARRIRCEMRGKAEFAVLFVDLDYFKKINDTFGHEAGDQVLREVATCIQRSTRSTDVIGRVGGEEFSILLPLCGAQGALQVAEQIRGAIEALMPLVNGTPLRITASIGVACSEANCQTLSALQRRADQAMYRAKQQGRNRVIRIEQTC